MKPVCWRHVGPIILGAIGLTVSVAYLGSVPVCKWGNLLLIITLVIVIAIIFRLIITVR